MSNKNVKNLPLLEAFDAILNRGTISGAAEAMNVTQSAVSKQLAQLRDWLGDELFVRTRQGMQPTPFALKVRGSVESIIEQANALSTDESPSPGAFTGKFVISGTDEMLIRLVPRLVDRLATDAPGLRLVTLPLSRDYFVRQLEAGQVNLVVAINWRAPDVLKQCLLGSDPFVCVMHEEHPLAGATLTLKRFVSEDHVLVAPLGNEKGIVDLELEKVQLQRRVVASVSAFAMVDENLLGRSRIVTVPSRVGEDLLAKGPFVVKRAPLPLPQTDYYALWHTRFSAEPRLRWMLDQVMAIFKSDTAQER